MKLNFLDVFIYGLACFRFAVLLSEDSGPAKMFSKLRKWLKKEANEHPVVRKSDVHHGIECLRCSSMWVAGPIGGYALVEWRNVWVDSFLVALALSACAILWNRAFPKR